MMQSNPMMQMMGMIRNGMNPQQLLAQMAQTNPQVRQAMQMMHGKSNAELRQMAMNMAKEQIRGGAYEKSEKLDDKTIEKWMRGLQNEDGTVGAHWTKDQTTQVMKQKNLDCDPNEFYVAMNLMYSDFFNAAKKANANNVDFYVNMAKAFLDDKDAGTEDKIAAYYEYIVK